MRLMVALAATGGYIPLAQAQAAVDWVGHRLIKVSRDDLKALAG